MKVLSDMPERRSGLSGEPSAPWAVACRENTRREGSARSCDVREHTDPAPGHARVAFM